VSSYVTAGLAALYLLPVVSCAEFHWNCIIHTHSHISTSTTSAHMHTHVHPHIHTHNTRTHTHTHTHTHKHTHTHTAVGCLSPGSLQSQRSCGWHCEQP